MIFRPIEQYLKEEMNIEMPSGDIGGEWFAEHHLPMVVACSECGMSMALPSAMVDNQGNIVCPGCC